MMHLLNYSHSYWSLLPTGLALVLAIFTHRVILSLGVGILIGSLMLTGGQLLLSLIYLTHNITNIIYNFQTSSFNFNNLEIILFLFLLGVLTSLLSISGSNQAFANWVQRHIKNRRGAEIMAASLVFITFIDGYFHSLAVGAIARPITDKFHVSRAKLAYILDSTAAPMCALMPISSWGAYVITLISGLLITYNMESYSPFQALMMMGMMNYYALFSIILVFLVAYFSFNIGPMVKYEKLSKTINLPQESATTIPGRVRHLILPITTLIISTITTMIIIGSLNVTSHKQPISLLATFEHTNMSLSLLIGAICSVLIASLTLAYDQQLNCSQYLKAWKIGIKAMTGALIILCFAWTINKVVNDMHTGHYLASLIGNKLPIPTLPALIFLLSAIMAIATGTSWGTFGMMLPIAAAITYNIAPDLILMSLSAVMAGAVCGDHCSPISDTTILSSTGAQCNHIEHVMTQLPYALLLAIATTVGYLVVGYTLSPLLGFLASASVLTIFMLYHIQYQKKA